MARKTFKDRFSDTLKQFRSAFVKMHRADQRADPATNGKSSSQPTSGNTAFVNAPIEVPNNNTTADLQTIKTALCVYAKQHVEGPGPRDTTTVTLNFGVKEGLWELELSQEPRVRSQRADKANNTNELVTWFTVTQYSQKAKKRFERKVKVFLLVAIDPSARSRFSFEERDEIGHFYHEYEGCLMVYPHQPPDQSQPSKSQSARYGSNGRLMVPSAFAAIEAIQPSSGVMPGGYIQMTLMQLPSGRPFTLSEYLKSASVERQGMRTAYANLIQHIREREIELPLRADWKDLLWSQDEQGKWICSIKSFEEWYDAEVCDAQPMENFLRLGGFDGPM